MASKKRDDLAEACQPEGKPGVGEFSLLVWVHPFAEAFGMAAKIAPEDSSYQREGLAGYVTGTRAGGGSLVLFFISCIVGASLAAPWSIS